MANKTYNLIGEYYSWKQIVAIVLKYPAHTDVRVEFNMVSEIPSYFKPIFADRDGQKDDYGYSLPSKQGIHIKVYDDCYKVHWDNRSSLTDPLGHLYHDARHWFVVLIMAIVGVSVGGYYAYKKYKSKSEYDE